MTGPLQQLLAMLMRKNQMSANPQERLIQQPGLQPMNEYTNRPPMPFRDPMQDTGPMPPMDPRILQTLMGSVVPNAYSEEQARAMFRGEGQYAVPGQMQPRRMP